jgi:hypothetical protein
VKPHQAQSALIFVSGPMCRNCATVERTFAPTSQHQSQSYDIEPHKEIPFWAIDASAGAFLPSGAPSYAEPATLEPANSI